MCIKLRYCAKDIDPCIREQVERINNDGYWKTISSCCGHGKYEKTILARPADKGKVINRLIVYDVVNMVRVRNYDISKKKQYNRFYAKDKEGYYYQPEIEEHFGNVR